MPAWPLELQLAEREESREIVLLEPYEDVLKMGVDKVWGIMPSPTHYLTRGTGIVRYNSFGRGVRDLAGTKPA